MKNKFHPLTWKGDRCFCGKERIGFILLNEDIDGLHMIYQVWTLGYLHNKVYSTSEEARKAVEERWEQFCGNISFK